MVGSGGVPGVGGESDLLLGLSAVLESDGVRMALKSSAAGNIETLLLGKGFASSSIELEKGLRLRRKVQRLLPLGVVLDGSESGRVATRLRGSSEVNFSYILGSVVVAINAEKTDSGVGTLS